MRMKEAEDGNWRVFSSITLRSSTCDLNGLFCEYSTQITPSLIYAVGSSFLDDTFFAAQLGRRAFHAPSPHD